MCVDETDALRVKLTHFDHLPDIAQLRHPHFQDRIQRGQRSNPVTKRTQGQLGDDERMHQNLSAAEQSLHLCVLAS